MNFIIFTRNLDILSQRSIFYTLCYRDLMIQCDIVISQNFKCNSILAIMNTAADNSIIVDQQRILAIKLCISGV